MTQPSEGDKTNILFREREREEQTDRDSSEWIVDGKKLGRVVLRG